MKYLKLNLKNPEKVVMEEILFFLKSGKVVALPTDTIYGLSCLATSASAMKKIAKIKKRSTKDSPFLILVSSVTQAKKYAVINKSGVDSWRRLQESSRPVSVKFFSKGGLRRELVDNEGLLGLRLPASDFLRKIVKLSGAPLVSTSFNLHGQETFADMSEAYNFFKNNSVKPDLIVDGGRPRSGKSSKLVDLSGEKELVLRK